MASYAELQQALKAVQYGQKAWNYANLINSISTAAGAPLWGAGLTAGEAATAGAAGPLIGGAEFAAAAAPATVTPLVGISAVTAPAALAMLANSIITAHKAGVKKHEYEIGTREMKSAKGFFSDLMKGPQGQDMQSWLNSTAWGGERVGDILYDLGSKNLQGYWLGEHGAGVKGENPPIWEPNERFVPIVAGLGAMGYKNTQRDTSDLLRYTGGWQPQKSKYGTPMTTDVPKGVGYWDKLLGGYSDLFGKQGITGDVPGRMTHEELVGKIGGAMPDLQSVAIVQNRNPGAEIYSKYAPEVAQSRGYTQDQLDKAWQDYQDQQRSFNAFQTQEMAGGGP